MFIGVANIFLNFTKSDLAMIALALRGEEKCRRGKTSKKKIWVHSAWKSRPPEGKFIILYLLF